MSTPSVTVFRSVAVVEAGSLWLFASSVVGSVVSPPAAGQGHHAHQHGGRHQDREKLLHWNNLFSFHFCSPPQVFLRPPGGERFALYTIFTKDASPFFKKEPAESYEIKRTGQHGETVLPRFDKRIFISYEYCILPLFSPTGKREQLTGSWPFSSPGMQPDPRRHWDADGQRPGPQSPPSAGPPGWSRRTCSG